MPNESETQAIIAEVQRVSDTLAKRITQVQEVVNVHNFALSAFMNAVRDFDIEFRDIYFDKITRLAETENFSEGETRLLTNYLKVLRDGEHLN